MSFLINRSKAAQLLKIPVRYKKGSEHWAKLKNKKTHKDRALEHFDDFYGNVYRKEWENIRTALLLEEHKYIAVVNNYGDAEKTESSLQNSGAINLKSIYDVFMENIQENQAKFKSRKKLETPDKSNNRMLNIISERQRSIVNEVYPSDYESSPESLTSGKEDEEVICPDKPLQPVELRSIEGDLNDVNRDNNRIVHPSSGMSELHEFIPATKLKGLEDWVLESKQYENYQKSSSFEIPVEKESVLPFPKHLKLYTFEEYSEGKFPYPKKGSTGVLDYFLFDGGSALPVLALDVRLGDKVLDMCAAPGGKTLTIVQTLMPNIVVANDVSKSRAKKINKMFQQFLLDIGKWEEKVFVTQEDARYIEEKDYYNKILVDVPCTTDRHALHEDDNNIFQPTRMKERLQIPELQGEILFNALKLVTVGGTVVYSTCTLSPIQNDGVVAMALKRMWEENNSVIVVKDMSDAIKPLQTLFNFGNFGLRYGHIVIPTIDYNWGPMYFCKMTKLS